MEEKWLLVGFTKKEIREKKYQMPVKDIVTLDRGDYGPFSKGDIDFKHDAFDVEVWRRILTIFGPQSFDTIFTDGGLYGIKRVEEIINIKRRLLKPAGHIINYMSPVGYLVRCPFNRPLHFYAIPLAEYTIGNMDRALENLEENTLQQRLTKKMKIII